ncbi:membrane protein insertase YidC [Atopobacter phocae]|uniref:membrane protein insertase YidC n=1 Tax=Atopobacter phocae TaxID=136492 RepID=UPI0004711E7C|nr:membrane protein insertase YidC [Atopobacter phocae]
MIKKHSKQKLLLLAIVLPLLAGCMRLDQSGNPTGFMYEYLVVPTIHLLDTLAGVFNNNYGLAIILVTLIVKLVLMPLQFSQMRKQLTTQEKMAFIKPKLNEIQERLKNAETVEERNQASIEMRNIYKDNNVSMLGGVGCLPLFIQMPIFIALYNAIRLTPNIAKSTFLTIDLGKSSIILAILAGAAYLIQSQLMMQSMPEEQRQQMKVMTYMNPAMIFFFSINANAGTSLYWFVGGLLAVLQTWIQNNYIRPKIKAEIDEELRNNPSFKMPLKEAKTVEPKQNIVKEKGPKLNTGRNKNIQQKRK